jgi:hypothetical protein
MALTKISRSLLDTGISDSSDATAVTIGSNEKVGIGTTSTSHQLTVNAVAFDGLQLQSAGSDCGYLGVNTNTVYVGAGSNLIFHTGNAGVTDGTERMRIDDSGYMYVGTTSRIISGVVNVENVGAANCFTGKVSNNAYYNFAGSNSSGTTTFYVKGDGDYYFAGTSQSDKDLKENIQPINESSLAKVKLLEPKTFNFKESEGYATNTKTGFIAQEVAEIFGTETGVVSGTDGQKDMGIDTTGIVAHLTKAIQEQQEQIEALQSEINTLKGG